MIIPTRHWNLAFSELQIAVLDQSETEHFLAVALLSEILN